MDNINKSDLEFSKLINIVTDIESILMKSNILWSINYNPSTKSYSIWLSEEEQNE